MESPNTYNRNKRFGLAKDHPCATRMILGSGFTLIEILIVIGILTMIMSVGLVIGMDSYKAYSFRTEESKIVSVLYKARSRAMNNMYQTAHSVCFNSGSKNLTIFRGTTYISGNPTNENIPINGVITFTGMPDCGTSQISFGQLTGGSSDLSFSFSDGVKSANININNEGTIIW